MEIVTVKMSQDCNGSPDGCRVQAYDEGQTYDLPADLANSFIEMGVAKSAENVAEVTELPKAKSKLKAHAAKTDEMLAAVGSGAEIKVPTK